MVGTAGATLGEPPCGALIDDLQSGTGRICEGNGRVGVWYAFNDGTGEQWPAVTTPGVPIEISKVPDGSGGGALAVHTYGSGFERYGAGVGLDLRFDGTTYGTYDARAHAGVSFLARGRGETMLQIRVGTAATTLMIYGGTCEKEPCAPHHVTFHVGPEWERFFIPFSQLRQLQATLYREHAFDPGALTNIQFVVPGRDPYAAAFIPSGGQRFDFWIDDVRFFDERPPCCRYGAAECARMLDPGGGALATVTGRALGKPANEVRCDDACSLYSLPIEHPSSDPIVGDQDIERLSCFTNLTRLTLSAPAAVSPLTFEQLPHLRWLRYFGVGDLSPIAAAPSLEWLELTANATVDAAVLQTLSRLTFLEVHVPAPLPALRNENALATLGGLAHLGLAGARIEDISMIAGMPELRYLNLEANRIADLRPLANLSKLTWLYLSDNEISDVSPIEDLRALRELQLATNQIADISGLSGLGALEIAVLSYNRIYDPVPLAALEKLRTLYLDGNPIEDVSPFLEFPALEYLSLNAVSLDCAAQRTALQTLQARQVSVSRSDCLDVQ